MVFPALGIALAGAGVLSALAKSQQYYPEGEEPSRFSILGDAVGAGLGGLLGGSVLSGGLGGGAAVPASSSGALASSIGAAGAVPTNILGADAGRTIAALNPNVGAGGGILGNLGGAGGGNPDLNTMMMMQIMNRGGGLY
jgi:hypothetical protein